MERMELMIKYLQVLWIEICWELCFVCVILSRIVMIEGNHYEFSRGANACGSLVEKTLFLLDLGVLD